jgi:hypothetical protein
MHEMFQPVEFALPAGLLAGGNFGEARERPFWHGDLR